MTHDHEHRHEALAHLFDDLVKGSGEALRAASAPGLTWWLPVTPSEYHGVAEAERALLRMFAGTSAELQSVILGGDGRSAVVEHLLHPKDGGTTPATSVLTLEEDLVIAGRTYLDVAAVAAVADLGGAREAGDA
jgi:hypothetical protein